MIETFETLRIEMVAEHVVQVTLNRPEAMNALNTQMGRDLVAFFEDVALGQHDLRCIILTGTETGRSAPAAISRNARA